VGGVQRFDGAAALYHPHFSNAGMLYHAQLPSGRLKSVMLARLDTPEGNPMGVLRVINRKGRLDNLGFSNFDGALMRLLSTKLAIAIERLRLIESRSRSITTTAHDLKTPLQNIRVTLDGFLERAFRLPDDVEQMRMSYNSCKLLDAFILSTIEVAQGKLDRARVLIEEIDAAGLIAEAMEVLKPKFDDPQLMMHRWKLTRTIEPGAEKIWGDRQQLLRLLLNLCHNAWKHGRATKLGLENGTEEDLLEITVRCDRDLCCLRVADRGPGLVSVRESRLNTDLAVQEDRGHGVGLASATLIAEAHRGKLVYGRRADGLSGFQVELIWNQEQLREMQV
jgi:signal transduction histidine kinase